MQDVEVHHRKSIIHRRRCREKAIAKIFTARGHFEVFPNVFADELQRTKGGILPEAYFQHMADLCQQRGRYLPSREPHNLR